MVGALGSSGILIFVAVFAVYAAVIWMIVDVLRRPDFSGGMKALWIILAVLFSIGILIIYVLVVRKKDYSAT